MASAIVYGRTKAASECQAHLLMLAREGLELVFHDGIVKLLFRMEPIAIRVVLLRRRQGRGAIPSKALAMHLSCLRARATAPRPRADHLCLAKTCRGLSAHTLKKAISSFRSISSGIEAADVKTCQMRALGKESASLRARAARRPSNGSASQVNNALSDRFTDAGAGHTFDR
jgi:hypothetical protein